MVYYAEQQSMAGEQKLRLIQIIVRQILLAMIYFTLPLLRICLQFFLKIVHK